ncbi:MAG TPA: LssY C-terminal domain-containing protein [Oscillatoriaceae cyanobacterium]
MSVISGLWSDVKQGAHKVAQTAAAAPTTAVTIARDSFDVAYGAGSDIVNATKRAPETIATWRRLAGAMASGQRTLLPARLPAYTPLDSRLKAAAAVRGKGQTLPQGVLGDKNGGHPSEPVTFYVTGSKDDLVNALRSQGWHVAASASLGSFVKMGLSTITRLFDNHQAPVSPQYLDGKLPSVVLEKNTDAGLGRDHMRVYAAGTDPATGQTRWAIAASRDVEASVHFIHPTKTGPMPWDWQFHAPTFGHETDLHADPERDMIMHDLLASGRVSDWQAVNGQPTGVKSSTSKNGETKIGSYTSDGKVYNVTLSGASS